MSRCGIGIATIDDYRSTTATDTDNTTATATSLNRDLTISGGGVGLWCVSTAATGDITWTNASEQYDSTPGIALRASAATYEDAAGSTRNASAAWGGSQACSMCAASFR
jgi:hypothetical protein